MKLHDDYRLEDLTRDALQQCWFGERERRARRDAMLLVVAGLVACALLLAS